MAWTTPRDWTTAELVTEAMMDTHIRDNFNALGPHLIARKTADEPVTSSTVLQNDDSLVLTVAANEVWDVEWHLLYTGAATGDLKVAFTFPAGGTVAFIGPGLDATDAFDIHNIWTTTTPTPSVNYGAAAAVRNINIQGTYINAGTAGSLQLQWAQATSDATATVVKANSTLWAVKLA